ncbi:MAG: allantoinase AllB [Bacteroidota bacterium]
MFDAIIKSNNVVMASGIKPAVVAIKNGVIAAVWSSPPPNVEQDIIDLGDKYLMPGIVDPHVHINEPGRTNWEGFDTATRAAIAGGVTTLVDMPLNASPVTTTGQALHQKISAAKENLHTNCGFWGGVVPGNENEIDGLIENGVLGFKAFLTHSGIDEFPNVTEADLRQAMPIIAKHNLPLLVHCELSDNKKYSAHSNPSSYPEYLSSRPRAWEDNAINLMIRLCEEYNCRVHIVHLSSSNSIEPIKKAKEKGLPLTVETAQHYLYFNAEDIPDGQTLFKCAPPIREKENNDLLWDALQSGVIDFVATDHSPAPPDMKEADGGNFMKAWGGIASLQFALPVLWTAAKKRNIPFTQVVKWLCEKPAALINNPFKKGKIEEGYDADLIVLEPNKKFDVTGDIIQHKHKITAYAGETLSGVVEQTWLNGMKIYANNNFLKLNEGKLLLP